MAAARRHYLAAKSACVTRYPDSLAEQSDCRSRAADLHIRPVYRYGDLMTRAQQRRRELAIQADRHETSRATYNREVARSEAAVAREENRRDAVRAREREAGPLEPLVQSIADLFR